VVPALLAVYLLWGSVYVAVRVVASASGTALRYGRCWAWWWASPGSFLQPRLALPGSALRDPPVDPVRSPRGGYERRLR
jgi:hypothetical protein